MKKSETMRVTKSEKELLEMLRGISENDSRVHVDWGIALEDLIKEHSETIEVYNNDTNLNSYLKKYQERRKLTIKFERLLRHVIY